MSTENATTTTTSSPPAATLPLGRGRSEAGIPLGKLADPLRWYFQWVRANPENATSLEQISRTFTLLVSDPTNLINSEACFTLCKVHSLSNAAIIATGSHHTTKTDILSFVLQAIQEVECLMELISRKYAGHRHTWNALLLLEAIKCTLKTCVHRQMFLIPWLWESLKASLRRAVRHFVNLGGRRRRVRGSGAKDGASITASFAAGGGGSGGFNGVNGGVDLGVLAGLEHGSSSLRGAVVGPNNTRLVIPRVASDRRHEHRHVFSSGGGAAPVAHDDGGDDGHLAFPRDEDAMDEDEVEEGESVPFTWVDVLGMLLDLYLLLRPLVLVAVARHTFLQLPEEEANSIATLPPVMTRAEQTAAAKEATEAAKAAKAAVEAGKPAPAPPSLPDPLAALHKAMSVAPTQNLMGSWRGWGAVAGCDLLVAFLARVVRQKRVPVVYINDSAESEGAEAAVAAAGGQLSVADSNEDAEAAAAAGGVVDSTAAGPNAIGPVQDLPVVSRDRMRVQQALRNTFFGFLRDPFFSAVLKQLIYHHFVKGFVNRIPLLGPCVSFYVIHYLSMQHYSFLYTLGQ
ncbi:hypothetical protein ABB37_08800 [Leptomonas pyrrhocoris]|uniref:Peroxisomal membrane protein PEX16 n=1 Tax=Leptomonas pyrrhocoris TaxID=157538 RepID=A0A0M9FSG7_LEPPY|nr:hypothetical protein ABB37_08800 [Leptomonas pyrrhocoris]KPA75135.1 hypothetical protein ABB37_08800 [Leptomonas pyrrhocoris]|eukprot:XP_015653574.1 hypothetical protein ABB37_08800 [Leptomonas pyrrhocoris]